MCSRLPWITTVGGFLPQLFVNYVGVLDNSGKARSSINIPLPGGPRDFPSFQVHGEHVWGLTYRILEQFLEVYPDGEVTRIQHPRQER